MKTYSNVQFEREKFEREQQLKEKEMKLESDRHKLERLRMMLIGIVVPVTLAVVAALPTAVLNLQNQDSEVEKIRAEGRKIQTEAIMQLFLKYQGEERRQAICGLTAPRNLIGESVRVKLRDEFDC